ncbi:sugar transferase, partial [Bacteroidota bacterium]
MRRLIDFLRKNYRLNLHRISHRLVFLSEALFILLAIYISTDSVIYYSNGSVPFTYHFIVFGLLVFLSRLALRQLSILSILPRTQRNRVLLIRFMQVTFIELIISTIIWAFIGSGTIPYILVPLYCIIGFTFTVMLRLMGYRFIKHYRAKGYNNHYVVIIADSFSDATIERLLEQKEWGFHIKYILSNSKLIKAKFGHEIKVFKESADLKFLIDCDVIDEVIYCKNKISNIQLKDLIKTCEEVGVLFRMQSNMSPLEPVKLQLQTVHMKPYFRLVDIPAHHLGVILKNLSDIYFSALALLMLSPILLLIALIIKLNSKGPVFYIQERIGLHGRRFKLFKFRTMVKNAASVQHILD